jgi:hypothetical protein
MAVGGSVVEACTSVCELRRARRERGVFGRCFLAFMPLCGRAALMSILTELEQLKSIYHKFFESVLCEPSHV